MLSGDVARPDDKFMLRLPNGMRDQIADLAKANGRSMNSEIIARLMASLDDDRDELIAELTKALGEENRDMRRRVEALEAAVGKRS